MAIDPSYAVLRKQAAKSKEMACYDALERVVCAVLVKFSAVQFEAVLHAKLLGSSVDREVPPQLLAIWTAVAQVIPLFYTSFAFFACCSFIFVLTA